MNTHSQHSHQKGFTLVESAVVMLVIGLILAMSVPSFQSYRHTQLLEAGSQQVLGQLRLARQKAIGIQHDQRVTFSTVSNNYTVQDLVTSQNFGPFTFPKGIILESASLVEGGVTGTTIAAHSDGRYTGSGEIVLKNGKGTRDTISVQVSGLALIR
jgi:prepilin-type N-terminal cleavage/methylation domain-containing protein